MTELAKVKTKNVLLVVKPVAMRFLRAFTLKSESPFFVDLFLLSLDSDRTRTRKNGHTVFIAHTTRKTTLCNNFTDFDELSRRLYLNEHTTLPTDKKSISTILVGTYFMLQGWPDADLIKLHRTL